MIGEIGIGIIIGIGCWNKNKKTALLVSLLAKNNSSQSIPSLPCFVSSSSNKKARVPYPQLLGPTRKKGAREDSRCSFVAAHSSDNSNVVVSGISGSSITSALRFQLFKLLILPRRDIVSRRSLPDRRRANAVPRH
jgi:hypothetical protein